MKKSTKPRKRIKTAKDLLKLKTSIRAGYLGSASPKAEEQLSLLK